MLSASGSAIVVLMDGLRPSVSVGIKLASLAIHADEFAFGANPHQFDLDAIRSILDDPEVVAYFDLLRPLALLPVKR